MVQDALRDECQQFKQIFGKNKDVFLTTEKVDTFSVVDTHGFRLNLVIQYLMPHVKNRR